MRQLLLMVLGLVCLASADAPSRGTAQAKCGGFPPTIVGSAHDDVLVGTPGHDIIAALGGNDRIEGRGGGDTVCGGPGDDTIRIWPRPQGGLDLVRGGSGNDHISFLGSSLNQGATPGPGDDTIECSPNTFLSFTSRVVVDLEAGTALGEGRDKLVDCRNVEVYRSSVVFGNSEPNQLYGSVGADRIYGRGGRDQMAGSNGDDLLDGGPGIDQVTYIAEGFRYGIRADLQTGVATGSGRDRLVRIENLEGSDRPDVLRGTGGPNTINGTGGKDRIHGRGGPDRLDGGPGRDVVVGGRGRDVVVGGRDRDRCEGEVLTSCP